MVGRGINYDKLYQRMIELLPSVHAETMRMIIDPEQGIEDEVNLPVIFGDVSSNDLCQFGCVRLDKPISVVAATVTER